jgi:hypothetical protein
LASLTKSSRQFLTLTTTVASYTLSIYLPRVISRVYFWLKRCIMRREQNKLKKNFFPYFFKTGRKLCCLFSSRYFSDSSLNDRKTLLPLR